MANVMRIKSQNPGRQVGEMARLKVVSGPDAGVVFVLTASRATIGRGENADVVLTDLKTSRAHAEILSQNGSWRVKDLGSANGIELNGKYTREEKVKTGDRIGLGESLFEFMTADVPTRMLVSPAKSKEDVQRDLRVNQQQKVRLQALTTVGGLKAAANILADGGDFFKKKSDQSKRVAFLAALLAAGAFFFFYDTENDRRRTAARLLASPQEEVFSLEDFLPREESPELKRTANHFFRAGFREYRAGNYLRARLSFETALQVNPSDFISKIYLENCAKAIQSEISFHMIQGKKGSVSGKLGEAKGHFEAVLRLLDQDPTSNTYKEAKESLEACKKQMEGRV